MDSSSQSSTLFRQKIALLIDFDNMILGIEDPGFDIEIVVNALRERGVMVLGRAYGDWYRHSRHRRRLMEQGIDLIETPVFGPIIKNSADMHMALDAFEIAHTQAHIDTFCIVSGDSDFLPLIKRLQTRDKTVIVIAGQKFTSELVRRNCNEYISYENLVAELMSAHEDVSVIDGAYHLLARAIDTLHERGVEVRSSGLKQMMVQLNPMFSERTFGCSQFRHFLDRAAKAGVVRMEGRDPHSGELLVSLVEEPEARADNRAEARSDNRSDRFDNRDTPRDGRGGLRSEPRERDFRDRESRSEPRERFDRFDRYEPRDSRPDARPERREADRRESNRAEARSEAPRVENRAEPVEPAREQAAPAEEAVAGTEAEAAAVEAREGRRRRGGRGRSKAEAREAEVAPDAVAEAPEAQSGEAQVLEPEPVSAGEEPSVGADEAFIDRNSQLGRVPLRRGRLRFSARLGRVISAEEAAAQTAAEAPAAQEVPEQIEVPEVDAETVAPVGAAAAEQVEEAPAEPQLFELPPAEATEEAAPEAVVEAAPEDEAKPKRRAPRRRSPRKKDEEAAAEAEAPVEEAAAPETPALEAAPEASAPEAAVEASVEAPAEAAAEPEGETGTKPKRAPRRRSPRKKAGEAAAEAAPSEAASGD